MKPYPFFELARFNRALLVMLLVPAILTVVGFIHGVFVFKELASLPANLPLTELSASLIRQVHAAHYLQLSQISTTLVVLTFYFVCWLYFASRNLVALNDERHHSLVNSLIIFARLMIGILFSLRMLKAMWRRSVPEGRVHEPPHWLVPTWWVFLIAANVMKITSVVQLTNLELVSEWRFGFGFMLVAYLLYFPLYLLTWKFAQELACLQRESHGLKCAGASP